LWSDKNHFFQPLTISGTTVTLGTAYPTMGITGTSAYIRPLTSSVAAVATTFPTTNVSQIYEATISTDGSTMSIGSWVQHPSEDATCPRIARMSDVTAYSMRVAKINMLGGARHITTGLVTSFTDDNGGICPAYYVYGGLPTNGYQTIMDCVALSSSLVLVVFREYTVTASALAACISI
jgi:hypothetical protein